MFLTAMSGGGRRLRRWHDLLYSTRRGSVWNFRSNIPDRFGSDLCGEGNASSSTVPGHSILSLRGERRVSDSVPSQEPASGWSGLPSADGRAVYLFVGVTC